MFRAVYLSLLFAVIAEWGIPAHGHNFCNPQKTLGIVQKAMDCGKCDKHEKSISYNKDVSIAAGQTLKAAFSVRSTKDFTSKKGGDIIPFDVIELNIGNGFHKNVFTCPIGGLYYMSWSYHTNPKRTADSELKVNGSVKRFTPNNAFGANAYPTGASAIIIHLKKGDRVSLNARYANYLFRNWASFQGWVIQIIP